MGFSSVFRNVTFFLIFILLLLLLISSSSAKMISSAAPSTPPPQPTSIKNKKTSSLFLIHSKHYKKRQVLFTNKNRQRSETTKINKNTDVVGLDDRVFSVMLPKGNVPPSGSSSCHNDNPNSVASLCALSSRKPQNIENP